MVYSNKVVAVVKVNGKVLREDNGKVLLPFGSEYSILIKNLDSVRISVEVSIDGADITDNLRRFIVEPNSEVELERFLRHGNMEAGNRFKFIERTEAVENHRGIKVEDGLIRVSWKRERQFPQTYYINCTGLPRPTRRIGGITGQSRGIVGQSVSGDWQETAMYKSADPSQSVYSMDFSSTVPSGDATGGFMLNQQALNSVREQGEPCRGGAVIRSFNDAGVTVAGSESAQQFRSVFGFATEPESYSIVLQLKGELAQQPVTEPVTVVTKLVCNVCGWKNRYSHKYCTDCGACLKPI